MELQQVRLQRACDIGAPSPASSSMTSATVLTKGGSTARIRAAASGSMKRWAAPGQHEADRVDAQTRGKQRIVARG